MKIRILSVSFLIGFLTVDLIIFLVEKTEKTEKTEKVEKIEKVSVAACLEKVPVRAASWCNGPIPHYPDGSWHAEVARQTCTRMTEGLLQGDCLRSGDRISHWEDQPWQDWWTFYASVVCTDDLEKREFPLPALQMGDGQETITRWPQISWTTTTTDDCTNAWLTFAKDTTPPIPSTKPGDPQ